PASHQAQRWSSCCSPWRCDPVSLHDDPGLQPERTSLAWTRTSISCLVVSAICLRWSPHYGAVAVAPALVAVVMALWIGVRQRHRYRVQSDGLTGATFEADVLAIITTTAATLVVGLSGLAIIAPRLFT